MLVTSKLFILFCKQFYQFVTVYYRLLVLVLFSYVFLFFILTINKERKALISSYCIIRWLRIVRKESEIQMCWFCQSENHLHQPRRRSQRNQVDITTLLNNLFNFPRLSCSPRTSPYKESDKGQHCSQAHWGDFTPAYLQDAFSYIENCAKVLVRRVLSDRYSLIKGAQKRHNETGDKYLPNTKLQNL